MYVRISLDSYIQGEFSSVEEATKEFMILITEDILEEDLSVEVFNDETKEWE